MTTSHHTDVEVVELTPESSHALYAELVGRRLGITPDRLPALLDGRETLSPPDIDAIPGLVDVVLASPFAR